MPPVVPTATYRLQLSSKLGFDDAAGLVPYLEALGVSHLYASPFLKARAGSTHGYDIVDHDALNPEFGGDEAFERLSEALAQADIGLILDFVPNHMGVGYADNAWWLDVLEWGPRSPHAASFDIEWETLPYRPNGGLLIPVLGKSYGEALDDGDLVLKYDAAEGSFSVWYFEHRLPIRPNRYGDILKTVVAEAGAGETEAGRRLLGLASRYPDPNEPTREHAPGFKADLAAVPGGAEIIERGLVAYRPGAADPTRLHRLLERQHYRVAHWRVAFTEINYRRFFDINDLAGIKVENLQTFDAAHRRVLELIRDGRLHGLRLDHVDGLADPVQYARRLSRVVRAVRPGRARSQPFYIVAEKILAEGEPMPALPGVAGTTGYDVLNVISRVLLDDGGMPRIDALYRDILGERQHFEAIVEAAKLRVLETMLASEFTVLCRLLARIAAGQWKSRDFTFDRLRAALQAYIVHFPVYRTYIGAGGQVSAEDRARIVDTIARARSRWFGPDADILDFLQDVLTLDLIAPGRQGYSVPRVRRFAAKVQQLTGPVMAKALEDTAFYRYHRLIALNEVGGEPVLPALSPGEFDYRMKARLETPHAMTATATHDTKRGEDARMRILAIPEIAEDFDAAIRRWRTMNERLLTWKPRRAPSEAHEYMLYQALLGVWPAGGADAGLVERMQTYAVKALREGKQETSWHNPNDAYESAVTGFLAQLLDPEGSADFLADFSAVAARTALLGALNSLSQLALKATIPGVPDIYQGTEFWDLSLVDPDNRRAVDFGARRAALDAIGETPDWEALAADWPDGRIKLALTHRLLTLRRQLPELFADGGYVPLPVEGPHAGHVLAFARTGRRDAVIVAAGRHFAPLTDGGCRWFGVEALDAVVSLDGWSVTADVLRPGVAPPSGAAPARALFGALPVAVLRATHGTRGAARKLR
ncbi:malto-oligosyltrehalose synthase [Rhodoplanes sp. TEM]|uniref:Malto-oligosyltrehalose synthase n=1 Tax=Rhodoplanes tepidamans TaxID=200616 RepID=A0ABT5JAE9_RHOTP|nr:MULTISPECIES: malto-oligosyltrehalose synthase [Rhodoplanes]MDC7786567.1 malto-oligosyltrehalose synthase [Rhodoplanes tepidamans]MDC7983095.1 malto-oligosyltrehalose synthase [Rhodoplanes sp. TEM]MDQ0357552.1 (1->4)-alpha-D-glucan 1-alpha-D-glucosylmutase [Rhodoplanes tepidamans]